MGKNYRYTIGTKQNNFKLEKKSTIEIRELEAMSKLYKNGITNEHERIVSKCSHCGAKEITKASIGAKCMYCHVGVMIKQ